MLAMRIGHGYDLHALRAGRPLILGGVSIDHHSGLQGHSDADVLAHAIADACLGAVALGDIGHHFPDSDDRYRNADSLELLRHVAGLCTEHGYRLINCDATVIAQAPKLAPHIDAMRSNLARVLDAREDQVSVKATTTEGLGIIGEEQAIAAMAVVLMGR